MAGTTVTDDGVVLEALCAGLRAVRIALEGPRFPALRRQAEATMDRSTITVFGELLDGDMHRARRANAAFEACIAEQVQAGRLREVPGAWDAMCTLRAEEVAVALSSGFAPGVQDAMVTALGWEDMIDLVLCPADVDGRGLPDPAMLLAAARRFDACPAEVVVAGDATADMVAARRAGAGLAIGVRSGAHQERALRAAGADAVIDSVADLPALLGLPCRSTDPAQAESSRSSGVRKRGVTRTGPR